MSTEANPSELHIEIDDVRQLINYAANLAKRRLTGAHPHLGLYQVTILAAASAELCRGGGRAIFDSMMNTVWGADLGLWRGGAS